MTVTLTNSDGIIFSFNDGDIESMEVSVNSTIEQYGMPGSDWTMAYAADFEGVRKMITLQGRLTVASTTRISGGGSVTTLKEQKDWLEALQDGNQGLSGTIIFTSSNDTSSVMVSQFKTTENAGQPNELQFNMSLLCFGF